MVGEQETLPRPAHELEELAAHYDERDTAEEMDAGHWVEPMVTTSLRLPRTLVVELKRNARREGKRHTAYIREILERSVRGGGVESVEVGSEQSEVVLRIDVAHVPREIRVTFDIAHQGGEVQADSPVAASNSIT